MTRLDIAGHSIKDVRRTSSFQMNSPPQMRIHFLKVTKLTNAHQTRVYNVAKIVLLEADLRKNLQLTVRKSKQLPSLFVLERIPMEIQELQVRLRTRYISGGPPPTSSVFVADSDYHN